MEETLHQLYRNTMISCTTSKAERITFQPGFRFGPHSHGSVEVILLLEGRCLCTAGKKQISLHPQDYLVFLSNTPHSFFADEKEPCTCLHLHFRPEYFLQVLTKYMNPTEQKLFGSAGYLCYPASNRMVRCLKTILREQEEKDDHWEESVGLLLCQALLLIARDHHASVRQKELGYSRPVKAAVDYIAEHACERMTLQEIAEHCYVSPTYLSSLFIRSIHTPIMEYIKVVKVRMAASRLAHENISFTTLALDLGFSSVQQFSKTFKEITGMLPKEFKESLRMTEAYAARLPKGTTILP